MSDQPVEPDFKEKSYSQQAAHYAVYGEGGSLQQHAGLWLDHGTVDSWRHQRMYQIIEPLLAADPGAEWLTVGDGRYGLDAQFLMGKGCRALPTDISDLLLKQAFANGLISGYRKENAESLSFGDRSFDYVLCKEAYHHFPRPVNALHEMLRVARKAVVLIEPCDPFISDGILEGLFRGAKELAYKLSGKTSQRHAFEPSGNYVYSISRREMEKVALGGNLRFVAFRGVNDFFLPGVENVPLGSKTWLERRCRLMIMLQDALCAIGFKQHRLLVTVLFKTDPTAETLRALRTGGFAVRNLPVNPYAV
jgi:SAM-dependent methyltransferase